MTATHHRSCSAVEVCEFNLARMFHHRHAAVEMTFANGHVYTVAEQRQAVRRMVAQTRKARAS